MRKFSILILIAAIFAMISCYGERVPYKPEIAPRDSNITDSLDIPSPTTFVEVDVQPEMIYEAMPDYPVKARESKIESPATLQVFVDTTGNVRKANAVQCPKPGWGFEEAAVASSYGCRFKPAQFKGRPVGVWVVYRVMFSLNHK